MTDSPCRVGLLLVTAIVSTAMTGQFATAQVKVYGTVLDENGKPISGVTVSLCPTGKGDSMQTSPRPTGADGAYEFTQVKYAAAYDILYLHSKYDSAVVERLSESKDQHINLVLHTKGMARSATAAHDTLQSAERLLFLTMAADPGRRKQLQAMLNEADFGTTVTHDILVPLDVSKEVANHLKARQTALRRLYETVLK